MNFRNKFLVSVAALVIFCLLWEFLVWVNDWPNYVMASPSDLGPSFWKFRWLFLEYGWDTLWRTVAGLLLAIAFGVVVGMIMGFSRTMRDARGYELLAMVGLEGFEDKKPSELSGGMRQRASLCRALAHRPEVLILDEPFGALDAFTREDLWQIMHELRHAEAFTCLLITHDLRESVFLADRVVVLSGRPAKTQYVLDVPFGRDRKLDDLFTTEATEMLRDLRYQIQVAQGRTAEAETSS